MSCRYRGLKSFTIIIQHALNENEGNRNSLRRPVKLTVSVVLKQQPWLPPIRVQSMQSQLGTPVDGLARSISRSTATLRYSLTAA